MSSAEIIEDTPDDDEDLYPYRALSKSAVFCLIVGLLSFTALMAPVLLVLPRWACCWGWWRWANCAAIRRNCPGGRRP